MNIIVVIHPRKEDENVPLSIASIAGTSKATQEADSVIILQVSFIYYILSLILYNISISVIVIVLT